MAVLIQFRRDTAANWTSVNPILSQGELGLETDTAKFKVGNGTSTWSALAYGGIKGDNGAGLTNITETVNTATPNATVPSVAIAATNAATDVDLAVSPKGAGAFSLSSADNATTGGNKRGANAIDLQTSRLANTQVASGGSSVVIGSRNTSSGTTSACLGFANSSTNTTSISIGSSNLSSGASATAIGNSNTASGGTSVCLGNANVSSGVSSIAMGLQANTFSITGRVSHGNSFFSTAGDSQWSRFIQRASTTDATVTAATGDGATGSATNRIIVQNNNTFTFTGMVTGRQTASTVAGSWKIEGSVSRGTTAATTAVLGVTVTAISNAGTWGTPTVTADTTNGALIVSVVGKAATSIKWTVVVETCEVINP